MNIKRSYVLAGFIVVIIIGSFVAARTYLRSGKEQTALISTPADNQISPMATTTSQETALSTDNIQTATSTVSSTPSLTFMQSTNVLFSSSPDYKNAYRIFPTFVSSAAKKAIEGFDMKTEDLGGGASRISLIAKQSEYQTQTFVLNVGQKLYFVERSFRDDSVSEDKTHNDDKAIAVDASGYILQ